jgi:methyltransferase-like protein 6
MTVLDRFDAAAAALTTITTTTTTTTTMDEAKSSVGDNEDDEICTKVPDQQPQPPSQPQPQSQSQPQLPPPQLPPPQQSHRLHRKKAAVEVASRDGDDGIRRLLERHAAAEPATPEDRQRRLDKSRGCWDSFFERNKAAFYKDKHHLRGEFGEMMPPEVRDNPKQWKAPLVRRHADLSRYSFPLDEPPPPSVYADKTCFLELGCGVGNAAFPLLRANPDLFGWCVDFSRQSIGTLQGRDEYDPERLYAFRADITDPEDLDRHIPASLRGTFQFVTAVWVLSAIDPLAQLPHVVWHVHECLAPGGIVLLRDYAVGDLSQLRLDPVECKLGSNFYVCGDGTLRGFMDLDETRNLFEAAGFETLELQKIRRNIVNHKEKVEMQRFWIQGKFRKRFT